MKIYLALILLFLACSDDQQAKGVTSETTNGGKMLGRIMADGNTPAKGARVRLLKEDPHSPDSMQIVLAQDSTDSNGQYVLEYEDTLWKGNVLVVADWKEQSCMKRSSLSRGDTLQLATPQKMQGKVLREAESNPTEDLEAYLLGLGFKAPVNAEGVFSFEKIPEGTWVVRIRNAVSGKLLGESAKQTVPETSNIVTSLSTASNSRTLLDDFEISSGASLLHSLHGDAYWGIWRDSSIVNPGWLWEFKPEFYQKDSLSEWGQSIHVNLTPVGDSTRSAGLSLTIGGYAKTVAGCWHNMDQLDSVRFMAKGSGTLWFGLVVRSYADSVNNGRFSKTIELTDKWTEYAFSLDEDLPYVPETWSSQQSILRSDARLGMIRWQASKSADLWLDNLVLTGMWPTDFLGCQEWE